MVTINNKVVLCTLLVFFATRYFITEKWHSYQRSFHCLTSRNKKGPTLSEPFREPSLLQMATVRPSVP